MSEHHDTDEPCCEACALKGTRCTDEGSCSTGTCGINKPAAAAPQAMAGAFPINARGAYQRGATAVYMRAQMEAFAKMANTGAAVREALAPAGCGCVGTSEEVVEPAGYANEMPSPEQLVAAMMVARGFVNQNTSFCARLSSMAATPGGRLALLRGPVAAYVRRPGGDIAPASVVCALVWAHCEREIDLMVKGGASTKDAQQAVRKARELAAEAARPMAGNEMTPARTRAMVQRFAPAGSILPAGDAVDDVLRDRISDGEKRDQLLGVWQGATPGGELEAKARREFLRLGGSETLLRRESRDSTNNTSENIRNGLNTVNRAIDAIERVIINVRDSATREELGRITTQGRNVQAEVDRALAQGRTDVAMQRLQVLQDQLSGLQREAARSNDPAMRALSGNLRDGGLGDAIIFPIWGFIAIAAGVVLIGGIVIYMVASKRRSAELPAGPSYRGLPARAGESINKTLNEVNKRAQANVQLSEQNSRAIAAISRGAA